MLSCPGRSWAELVSKVTGMSAPPGRPNPGTPRGLQSLESRGGRGLKTDSRGQQRCARPRAASSPGPLSTLPRGHWSHSRPPCECNPPAVCAGSGEGDHGPLPFDRRGSGAGRGRPRGSGEAHTKGSHSPDLGAQHVPLPSQQGSPVEDPTSWPSYLGSSSPICTDLAPCPRGPSRGTR